MAKIRFLKEVSHRSRHYAETKRLIRNVSSTFYDEFRVQTRRNRSFHHSKTRLFSSFEAKVERRLCRWWKATGERNASSRPREPGVPLAPAEQGLSGAPAARQGFPPAVGSVRRQLLLHLLQAREAQRQREPQVMRARGGPIPTRRVPGAFGILPGTGRAGSARCM